MSNLSSLTDFHLPMRSLLGVTVIALLLIVPTKALAQSGGEFMISSHSIDSGGGASTGGQFSLVGVIGQPDAGPTLTGGNFSLTGGFLFYNTEGARVYEWLSY